MTGSLTVVDYSKLCAYIPGLSPSSMQWVFDMEDLIILPCVQVSQAVCSTVHIGSLSQTVRMPVAITIRISQQTSGGRRLLSTPVDDNSIFRDTPQHMYESEYELVDSQALHGLLMAPGWNLTSAPCSSLVMAYQKNEKLGILETYELHK